VREAGIGAIKNIGVPVATATAGAAAGVAGGLILGRAALKRPRKVLGITLPGQTAGLSGVAKEIGGAGKQLGKLASEVRAAREKAEEIGKVLS
jgi:hypothetical protein